MSGFTFRGIRKSYVRMLRGRKRPVFAPLNRNILQIPGRPGGVLQGTDTGLLTIEVPVVIHSNNMTHLQELKADLASWLINDKPAELKFDDEPNRTYFAIYSEQLVLDEIARRGTGTLTFLCLDPYKYGDTYTHLVPPNSSTTAFYVEGQVETFPTIRAIFKKSSEFLALSPDEDRIFMIGESPDVEVPVVPYEQLILHDELSTLTPWTAVNTNDLDGGTATMSMGVNGGYRFYVPNYGTGPKWHGAAVKRSLPEPVQDFLVQAQFTQRSTDDTALGRVELYLLSATGDIVAKLAIRDSDPLRYVNLGMAKLGTGLNGRDLIYHKDTRLKYFQESFLRLRRVGQNFSAQIARIDPITKLQTYAIADFYTDIDNLYQAPIAQIMINISAHGTNPSTLQYADDIKIWKVNQVTEQEIPIIFASGDVVEIDMNNNKIFKNGLPFMKYLQPGSDFFSLRPGDNNIKIYPPDAADLQIDYRSRWY